VKGIEKVSEERRAAGSPPVGDTFVQGDVERREGVFDMLSVSKPQGRRLSRTAPPNSSGISKTSRSGPVRRKTNEEPGMSRGFSKRAGTRPGLRSRGKQLSQDTGTNVRDEETDGGLEGGVEQMLLDDQES
jgi:hypothetical protein